MLGPIMGASLFRTKDLSIWALQLHPKRKGWRHSSSHWSLNIVHKPDAIVSSSAGHDEVLSLLFKCNISACKMSTFIAVCLHHLQSTLASEPVCMTCRLAKEAGNRHTALQEQLAADRPKLQALITETHDLKTLAEQHISSLLGGHSVHIMGEINMLNPL